MIRSGQCLGAVAVGDSLPRVLYVLVLTQMFLSHNYSHMVSSPPDLLTTWFLLGLMVDQGFVILISSQGCLLMSARDL